MPFPAALHEAYEHTALGAGAGARLGAGLAALILALLVRLFGRTGAAWDFSVEYGHDDADGAAARPHAIILPAIGRAPHAAWIESGRVPDWILPGIRNRGMRPAAPPACLRPHALRRRALPARAPPGAHPLPC